ncbi:MAG: GntR family transcriptional regulator [Brevefilum sp.]
MEPNLNRNNPTPIFEQITDWMRKKIQSGEWQDNQQILSETELCDKLAVSRGTIRKAVEVLISERLLVRIHGKGTFVKNKILLEQKPTWRLAGFSRDLISRGIPYSTKVLRKDIITPSEAVREKLKLSPTDKIFNMQRLRKINQQPVLLIENHIVYDYCEGVEQIDFEKNQLYFTLENKFNIQFDWANRTYRSMVATPEVAELLNLPKNAPLMYLEEQYHDINSTPVEYTRAWFDAQVFYIKTTIQREEEKSELPGIFH